MRLKSGCGAAQTASSTYSLHIQGPLTASNWQILIMKSLEHVYLHGQRQGFQFLTHDLVGLDVRGDVSDADTKFGLYAGFTQISVTLWKESIPSWYRTTRLHIHLAWHCRRIPYDDDTIKNILIIQTLFLFLNVDLCTDNSAEDRIEYGS